MVIVIISQSANACYIGSGANVSSIGKLLFADSYLIRFVFAAFSFSTQSWAALHISSCTT